MLTMRMHIPPPTASGPHTICLLRATHYHPPSTLPPTLHMPSPLHPTSPHCCSATPPRLPAQPRTPTDPPCHWWRRWRQGQITQASHVMWPISSSSSDDADPRPPYDPCPALTPPSPSTTRPQPPSPPPMCHQPLPSTCPRRRPFPTVTHPPPRRTCHAQHAHHRPRRHAPLSGARCPRTCCPAPPSGFFLGKSNLDRSHRVILSHTSHVAAAATKKPHLTRAAATV